MSPFLESTVELAALEYLAQVGVPSVHGDTIAPDGPHPERETIDQVILRESQLSVRVNGKLRVRRHASERFK